MSQRIESKKEENLNTITHAFGLILSIIGLYFLIEKSIQNTDKLFLLCSIIYGLSLVSMYSCSTLYHYFYHSKYKSKLRIADHISIYILIAGSYTPGLILKLHDGLGMYLLYIVWGIAVLGFFLKFFFINRFEKFSLLLYIIMGWLIIVDYNGIVMYMNTSAIQLMFLGGIFYMIGVAFYSLDKMKYNHVIWHFFVLLGSASHYFMIYKYII